MFLGCTGNLSGERAPETGYTFGKCPWPLLVLTFLLVGLGVSGCGGFVDLAPGAGVDSKRIVVLGSDTMESMVRNWANGYMTENPGCQVTVSAGDTGAGIRGLIAGEIDVASASRELSQEENALVHKEKTHLKRVMVARDSIAVIVNPVNKLDEIGLDDLRLVYAGEIKTWDKLSKEETKAEPIRVFAREMTSGTADYFREHVMQDKPFGPEVKLMPSSEAVIGAVFGNRLGIGFVGMSQAQGAKDKVKILELSLRTEAIKEPAQGEASRSLTLDSYPLSRPLYVYYNAKTETKVKPFIDYLQGKNGRKQVVEMGFMPAP